MGIVLASNFDVNAQLPLDSRFIKADLTARDAIDSGVRFQGLLCYVVADSKMYQLQGGITNGDWKEAGGGGATVWAAPEYFAGTGSQTVYTLAGAPTAAVSTFVSIAGVLQQTSSYTTVGTTLTFSEAPPAPYPGVTNNIEVRYCTGAAGVLNPPAFNSVLSAASGYVTTSSFANLTNLAGTITTTGRPIYVGLVTIPGSGNELSVQAVTGAVGKITIIKNAPGSVSAEYTFGNYVTGSSANIITRLPPTACGQVWFLSAGTYIFTTNMEVFGTTPMMIINGVKLLIYEM